MPTEQPLVEKNIGLLLDLADILNNIGFRSSIADPDVWIISSIKPDGQRYYEYILVYVDDILCTSHDPKATMKEIQGKKVKFKKNKVAPPEVYLGATLQEKKLNDFKCWTMMSHTYLKAAFENVERQLPKW